MTKSVPNKLGKERYFTKGQSFFAEEHYVSENYPLHWHEFYEIEYVVSGHSVQIVNGIEYEVGPGFAVLLTPADMHAYKNVDKNDFLTIRNVKFTPYILPPEIQERLNRISAPLCGYCPELSPIFGTLLKEYAGRELARETYVATCITQICVLLFRFCEETPNSVKTPEREMIQYIREHFLEPINVETVAGIVHLSPNYFSNFFKKHMGVGFSAYVKKLRLEFAANLLLTSNMTVREVAETAGFNSPAHFLNSFKSVYGATPEKFRSRCTVQETPNGAAR